MQKFVSSLLILLLPVIALADGPVVTYRYSPVFDRWCTGSNGTEVLGTNVQQLLDKVDAMQKQWDEIGPKILATTEELIGKPWLRSEVTATLFLCGRTPSMSLPLLINGNWFVKGDPPLPTDMATHIVFHELLHIYLVDHFPGASPLRKKYEAEGENFLVLNHLHLMAVQKLVYLELGLEEELARVIENDSKLAKDAYKRSWEIVNNLGQEAFIAELD